MRHLWIRLVVIFAVMASIIDPAVAFACDCNNSSLPPGGIPAAPPAMTGYSGPSSQGELGCPMDDLGRLMDIIGKPRDDAKYWLYLATEKNPDGSPKAQNARMYNGYKFRGPPTSFTVPSGWGGAHMDWWDRFKAGTSYEGQGTPDVVEATLWLTRCNP